MRTYRLNRGLGIDGLELTRRDRQGLAPDAVRVRVRAASLNHRDLTHARAASGDPITPLSDGAGEVIETGAGVTRFEAGDRVMASFFPDWIEGPTSPDKIARPLGGKAHGMLTEEIVLPEHSWSRVPEHLSFEEAATLPCAGVTAWNALFVAGTLTRGASVLLLGTGGVSLWALQLASAAGIRAIITSSDDAKLVLARKLGAAGTINYITTPEWDAAVRDFTDGMGVDLVVETVGRETLGRSLRALRPGGTVARIGGMGGWGGDIDDEELIGRELRIAGVQVGSRAMLDTLGGFTASTRLRPVIDRSFAFDAAREAYRHLASGRHFGKVVIEGA